MALLMESKHGKLDFYNDGTTVQIQINVEDVATIVEALEVARVMYKNDGQREQSAHLAKLIDDLSESVAETIDE